VNANGDPVEAVLSCYPVRGEGTDTQLGVIVIDVTERNRMRALAEEALRLRLEQQEAAIEILQHSLLPGSLPDVPGAEVAARYRSASDVVQVGGDWYDALVAPGAAVVHLAVGDVSGHGLEAVATMGQLRSAGRAWFLEDEGPAAVLARLNRLVLATMPGELATLAVAAYDPGAGRLELALAGHPPPVVARADGSAEVLACRPGLPLGVVAEAAYDQVEVVLAPGDTVVLYTDGLIERRGEVIDVGLERLRAAAADTSALALDAALEAVLVDALPGSGRFDDVCVLALRRRPSD
jgi:serine phosphatase RsbU (regulator of sigma subunit)